MKTHTRRRMIHYSLLDSQKYYLCISSNVFKKYFVMSACGEMFAKNCCADLTTKSITRVLVNQSIFKHNFSTQLF